MRTCDRALVALVAVVVLLGVVVVSGSSSLVSADPCTAQVGNSFTPTTYYGSSFQMVVPVSVSCSFSGSQLYAVGNIYDVSTNSNLGSVNAILSSVDGGNTFNGQLVFNIPPVAGGDNLQISASIYSDEFNGLLLTTATQTVQVYAANYYAPPAYPGNYWGYPSYPSYEWSPPSYPSYPSYTPNPSPPPGHHDYDHSTPPSTPPSSPPGNHENPPWHHNDPTPPSTPPVHHDNPTPTPPTPKSTPTPTPTPPSTSPHSPHDPHH